MIRHLHAMMRFRRPAEPEVPDAADDVAQDQDPVSAPVALHADDAEFSVTPIAPCDETRAGFLTRIRALVQAGCLAEADAALTQGRLAFHHDAEIVAEWAILPSLSEDWPEGATRWRHHLEAFPDLTLFWGIIATAFARSDLHAEAESLLARALALEPTSIVWRVDHAIIAQFAGDWALAVQRWDRVLKLKPDDAAFRDLRSSAHWHLSFSNLDHPPTDASPQAEPLPAFETVISTFESLGDNCEFGLLQRRWGIEPLGLFRFAYIVGADLVTLLQQRLAPLGDPEHTVVEEQGGEYVLNDTRGYYSMHSFVRKGQMDERKYLKQQTARISLLKRKLLGHFAVGDRIFICKDSKKPISDEMLLTISDCLKSYGPNLLLGLRQSDPDHAPGSVDELSDGILIGYVSCFFGNGAGAKESDTDSWAAILQKAYEHHGHRRILAAA